MEKPAPTEYPINDLLGKRWSPRAFSDQMVEFDKLRSLFEAARWAPSSNNGQPWSFIVATKHSQKEYDSLLACLMEGNIRWAKLAPVLMVSVARLNFEENGKPNRHAFHDVGQAVANLTVQATALHLAVHQMGGFYPDKVKELYGIPHEYEPVAAMAIGYPGKPEMLPEQLMKREYAERERKPISEFVFSKQWTQVSPIISSE